MPKYTVDCPDGTARKCWGSVSVFIEKEMHESEVDQYIEDHDILVDVCGACGSDSNEDDDDDD